MTVFLKGNARKNSLSCWWAEIFCWSTAEFEVPMCKNLFHKDQEYNYS